MLTKKVKRRNNGEKVNKKEYLSSIGNPKHKIVKIME